MANDVLVSAVAESELREREIAGLDALAAALPQRGSRLRRIWNASYPPIGAALIFILLWQIVVWTHWRTEDLLPSPFTVFKSMKGQLGTLWSASLTTLWRGVKGFLVAVVIGSAIGIITARSRIVRSAIGSMITGLQTMPSVAWTPLAIVIFKAGGGDVHAGENAILFVMVLGAAPSVVNGLLDGIDHISPVLLRAGRVLGADGFSQLRHVVIPAALPSFVSGLKQAWAFSWRALMGAELLVNVIGKTSLGQQLEANQALPDFVSMYADIIAVLIIGIVIDRLVFNNIEKAIRKRYGLVDAAAA